MEAQGIHERLRTRFDDAIGELTADNPDPWIEVSGNEIVPVATFLKTEKDLAFDFLESISGVDDTERLWLVYHLFSYTHRHSIVLKLKCGYEAPTVPSCSGVWAAAEWHEREQYDLFGFEFTGHPDLRRILLPEDWEGWPLRKDYEYPDEYHGIDHYRPDPKLQFKALDELAAKAAQKAEEQRKKEEASADGAPSDEGTAPTGADA